MKEGWNGYSVLHSAASRVGALDLGFVPGEGGLTARQMAASGTLDVLFLLGVDEIEIAPGAFTIYIGSNGDRGATRADVILPGAAYPEKSGDLRQHRRPGADGDARLVPAWRRARGLGDPARAVGCSGQDGCPTICLRRSAPGAVQGASALAACRPDRARRCGRPAKACRTRRQHRAGAVSFQRRRFLFHQCHRALFGRDGGMFGDRARPRGA